MERIRRVFSLRISSPVLSGLLYAFMWMLAGAFALSLLLWASNLSEDDLSLYTFLVHGVAALFGGIVSGKRSGNRGWYHGFMAGMLYGMILWIIGFLALNSPISLGDVTLMAIVMISGAVGGMFGVNIRK